MTSKAWECSCQNNQNENFQISQLPCKKCDRFLQKLLTICDSVTLPTSYMYLHPFLPGSPYKGQRQTLHNVASDQGQQCSLIGFSIKNRINGAK